MKFPSCAILEPERPGAEAEPESKEPPWILYISLAAGGIDGLTK